MIRVGIVSTVNQEKKAVRVVHPDLSDRVSLPLPVLNHVWDHAEPAVGEYVLCCYLDNDQRQGFCIGTYTGGE